MADLTHGDLSNYELSQELHLNKYAQHILDNGKSVAASTPTITTISGSDFLQKLSATILNSIQFQTTLKQQQQQQQQQQLQQQHFSEQHTAGGIFATSTTSAAATTASSIASALATNMDFDLAPNHIVIDSSNFGAIDDLQKQLEYDKFMNDVWIGIVMTLILISMVFCICSCFLYHQFRTWKQNYNATVAQSQAHDVESMKLNPEHRDDPVPEYTLVSGLPSYEAALELLQKTPNSCVLVYPSVFSIFNKNERITNKMIDVTIHQQQHQQQQYDQQLATIEVTTPLMAGSEFANVKCTNSNNNNNNYNNIQVPSYAEATAPTTHALHLTAVSEKPPLRRSTCDVTSTTRTLTGTGENTTTAAATLQKVPAYEEALLVKNDKQ